MDIPGRESEGEVSINGFPSFGEFKLDAVVQLAGSIFGDTKVLLWTYLAGNLKEKFPFLASISLEYLKLKKWRSWQDPFLVILKILLRTNLAGNLKEKFPLMASLPLENLNLRQDKSVTSISLKKRLLCRSYLGWIILFPCPSKYICCWNLITCWGACLDK